MLKLEVKSAEFVTREGLSKRTGKPYSLRLQYGWLHGVDGYPARVEFTLKADQAAFVPGFYAVGPECFQVDRNLHPVIELNRASPAK